MAATSEGAIDWAAGQGFSILMDPHCTHADLGRKRARYGERLAAAGHSPAGPDGAPRDIPMARLMAIAPTAQRAEEIARRGAQWTVGSYMQGGPRGPDGAPVDPVERYVGDVILHGTPESLVDQIAALKETAQLNYLLCAPLSQESFTLLTEKVLPRVG
jgi:alkanesulfonate monooxygenase SsuD/methylene tetrahydromethanopterin reductase-like flavin-dependent oxidoreductase (luciferase family)